MGTADGNGAEKPGKPGIAQSDLLSLIGYGMKRAYMRISQDFTQTLDVLNLRQRTFSVLSLVVENPDVSQSDIARTLGIERSGTVVIVDELEGRDLIRRDKVPGDRRAYALRATNAGIKLYKTALRRIAEHEDRVLSGLSPAERAELQRLLEHIHELNPE